MRKLIFAINITLDGCCDHTKVIGSEEILDHYTQLLRGVDLFVYGRKTYQLMVPYWPDIAKSQAETKAENEFAREFDSHNKIVFTIVGQRGRPKYADCSWRPARRNSEIETTTRQGYFDWRGGYSFPAYRAWSGG